MHIHLNLDTYTQIDKAKDAKSLIFCSLGCTKISFCAIKKTTKRLV